MKVAKALGIGTASAAGAGAAAFGTKGLTSLIKRNSFLREANTRASKIEEVWKGSFYALRDESEDRKWEWLYLKKVLDDGKDRKTQVPYSEFDKTKWEDKYWERISDKTTKIAGVEVSKIKEIYNDDQNYNTKWRKFKEICLIWYAKWEDDGGADTSNDVDTTNGHACLYNGLEIPWTELEDEYKSDPSKDPGVVYWERAKRLQSQSTQ